MKKVGNLEYNEQQIAELCQKHDISYLALFGSYLHGDNTDKSDVDLLVEFKKGKSLLEKGSVIVDFKNIFEREVDLVSKRNIKSSLKPYIADSQLLYEEKEN